MYQSQSCIAMGYIVENNSKRYDIVDFFKRQGLLDHFLTDA